MSTSISAYLKATFPTLPWLHLSDEDIAAQLDKSQQRSRAARKAQERKRQKLAEEQTRHDKNI